MFKITKDQLEKEYIINKLTSYEIAEKYGCSAAWINILRKRYAIRSMKTYKRCDKQTLSPRQEEFIYGTLLGDASIKFGGRIGNKNAFLSISQSNKSLTEFKYNVINDFVKTRIKSYKCSNRKRMYYFNTISHPIFTNIFEKIYLNATKTISKAWLNKLTPLSLAIWYMDDGSITQSTHQMRISTESFSYEEHAILKKHLKERWHIEADIIPSARPHKFILFFKAKERDKFFELIEQFILPEMQYKLCKNLRKWEKWSYFELEYLKKNYTPFKINWEDMLKFLNHSKEAILRKASYLGFSKREVI